MLAHSATREGIVAVNSMFGRQDTMRFGAIPWVVYTHPEAAGVGKTEQALKDEGIEYTSAKVPMAIAGRYVIEDGSGSGMVKVLAGKQYGEILGVHAVGKGCSEFIFGAAAMIETQARIDDISEIVFPHPTISEALKEAIVHLAG
jgi:dihydrolipoamide dehydrogenase